MSINIAPKGEYLQCDDCGKRIHPGEEYEYNHRVGFYCEDLINTIWAGSLEADTHRRHIGAKQCTHYQT